MPSPLERYQQLVDHGELEDDPQQAAVMHQLDGLHHTIKPRRWWQRAEPLPKHGIYLWGSVGSGKTCLMDIFYQATPGCWRCHSHVFFESLLDQLADLQTTRLDPLPIIAKRIAKQTRLICLDEFQVDDIANAMLLTRLLPLLFAHGINLVTTSNTPPQDLYLNGLQRQNFMPTIALIKRELQILELSSTKDYRQLHQEDQQHWHSPNDDIAEHAMQRQFLHYSNGEVQQKRLWLIGRPLTVLQRSNNSIWFDFLSLCQPPRCQRDYLQLAKKFEIFFISNISPIPANKVDLALNFIHLIDVLYDQQIQLFVSADCPIEDIYPSGQYQARFTRTISRLKEMTG